MPGVFGGVGAAPRQFAKLEQEFSKAWGSCSSIHVKNGVLGGHAFGNASALHRCSDSLFYAVDGAISCYRQAGLCDHSRTPLPFSIVNDEFQLSKDSHGNIVACHPERGLWYLACEWSGTFPLYYAATDSGLLFSSLLRPLARTLSSSPDEVGIFGFLLNGYNAAGRTFFEGIRRLLPGQILRFDARNGTLRFTEQSRLWTLDDDKSPASLKEAAVRAWAGLESSTLASSGQARSVLMMSGGWDSRTLLGALLSIRGPENVLAYSHGDVASRELRLVKRIAAALGVECRLEPLCDKAFDPEVLATGFTRVENVSYPHWHWAGQLLGGSGEQCAMAGVYGEILGGHYGPAMLERGSKKILAVGTALLGRTAATPRSGGRHLDRVREQLRITTSRVPWYFSTEMRDSITENIHRINSDIDEALLRLSNRGVTDAERLIEAYISEHRGTQVINSQILSMRAHLDVALPFCHQDLLLLASRIPLRTKIHNAVNQEMLRARVPRLLRYPCSATLVPASAPVWLQESSRLIRRGLEQAQWKAQRSSNGRIDRPRFGWVNFDFLRASDALSTLVRHLQSPRWNHSRLQRRVAGLRSGTETASPQSLAEGLLNAYTVELMLQ